MFNNCLKEKIPMVWQNSSALPWSSWSKCDPYTGLQNRTRSCEPPKYNGKECNEVKKQVQKCDIDCNCDGISWATGHLVLEPVGLEHVTKVGFATPT